MKSTLNNEAGDGTHICLVELKSEAAPGKPARFCNAILKLHKSKATPQTGAQTWLTTRAAEHLAKEHPEDSPIGKKAAIASKQREQELMGKQMAFGMPNRDGAVVGTDNVFSLTPKEKALSSQAQWYVYSTMHISKSEFESVYFKRMLAGGGDTEKAFVLTERNLKNYVKAEFNVFLLFLEFMLNKKHADAMGNKFAQGLHDGGTLESKKKYQALALQFIAPGWAKNFVITIGLKKSSHNKDVDVANLWKEVMAERCGGLQFEDVVGRMRSDRAAKGVAGVLEMVEEVCEMHDTDKLGQSGYGGLIRTKNKFPVNPFPDGVALVQRAHKLGAYFGYSTSKRPWPPWGRPWGTCPTSRSKSTTTPRALQQCMACCTLSSA